VDGWRVFKEWPRDIEVRSQWLENPAPVLWIDDAGGTPSLWLSYIGNAKMVYPLTIPDVREQK